MAWWWVQLLLAPVYFVVGALRHHGLHAFAAWTFGADVILFRILPHWHLGKLRFGRVVWRGDVDRGQRELVLALPYLVNTVCILCWVMSWQCFDIESFQFFWSLTALLLISPAFDTFAALFNGYVRHRGDFHELRELAHGH